MTDRGAPRSTASTTAFTTFSSSSSSLSSSEVHSLRKMHERELRRQAICTVHQLYLHMTYDQRYHPSWNIAHDMDIPEHPVLAFWRRGPGYRRYQFADFITNVDYFVFEPDWLHSSDGVMHTMELRVALGGNGKFHIRRSNTQSLSFKDDNNSDSDTTSAAAACIISTAVDSAMIDRVSSWQSQHASWIELDAIMYWEDDDEAALCGTGDAVTIQHTRAIQHPRKSNREMCYRSDVGEHSNFTMQPISQWSSAQVTYFLFAWQRLQRVYDQLMRENASVHLGLAYHYDSSRESWLSLTVPLPFILPWPTMEAAASVENEVEQPLTPRVASVRGCQWLTMTPTDSNASHDALRVIAQLVAQQLHMHTSLSDVFRIRPETFHDGKRTIHADSSIHCEHPMDSFFRDASLATLTD